MISKIVYDLIPNLLVLIDFRGLYPLPSWQKRGGKKNLQKVYQSTNERMDV